MKTVRTLRSAPAAATTERLLQDLRELILAARERMARAVNSVLVLRCWQVGQRIRKDVIEERRAEYGAEILPTLSAKLMPEFGRGYSSHLLKCRHPSCPRLRGNAVPRGENEL